MILSLVLVLSLITFSVFTSYSFQILIRKKKIKKIFLDDFTSKVKGTSYDHGYFTNGHRLIFEDEYKHLPNSRKINYTMCYDIISFKTSEADWELFFHLVKEGLSFTQIITIRSFSKYHGIKSEATIEKTYSRLNILANNRYLANILETPDIKDSFKWLLRKTADSVYVSHRDISFRGIVDSKNMMSKDRAMDMVKSLNHIKNKIYRKNVIEY